MPKQWWDGDDTEIFWLETTDRADLGSDLRAPLQDASGKELWRYTMFRRANPGDIVFHYRTDGDRGIVGASQVIGEPYEAPIIWGARGTYAVQRGEIPHEQPGLVQPLQNFFELSEPVLLEEIRAIRPEIESLVAKLKSKHPKSPLYFPFELGRRPSRAIEGYAFKLPREFVELFPRLMEASELLTDAEPSKARRIGTARSGGQGFSTNRSVTAAVEKYAMDAAKDYFAELGYGWDDTSSREPYDLEIKKGRDIRTVEVKGTTSTGEAIFLTANEVAHTRDHLDSCVLFILHSIKLTDAGGTVALSGGERYVLDPWNIVERDLRPIQYQYLIDGKKASSPSLIVQSARAYDGDTSR